MTSDQEPILASWKISEVLRRYPQLLDVLIDLSPAFAKLRNPMLRKVQTRLVTVQQAAGIAGIEPAALTRRLNQAVGITAPDDAGVAASAPAESVAPPWAGTAPVAATLDVRPLLARGEEPFKAIMGAARAVPVGSVLHLTVGFEPLPLYDALARQGFAHHARPDGDAWQVDFYRERAAGAHATASTGVDWDAPSAEVTIDVSELVPPEPMVKVLQSLETLPDGARLLVHHVRRPMHLYDRLDEMGYAHATRELAPDRVEVMIQKPGDAS
ncbi:MAG TPA: DUF2249 domain-containing protein [Thermomicrobiales bacterium]|nr:DUF2249 domain-containing protein [Thermomicrobiales bacterium]